jgi:hypothetical protein
MNAMITAENDVPRIPRGHVLAVHCTACDDSVTRAYRSPG